MRALLRGLFVLLSILAVALLAGLFALRYILKVNLPSLGPSAAVSPQLPPGFRAEIVAEGLDGPRFMAVAADGTTFVAERGANRVIAIPPGGGAPVVVQDGLDAPSSVWVDPEGRLLVGETTRAIRLTLGPDGRATGLEVLVPDLPAGGAHTTRTVILGADGRLYIAAGSSCNVCVEDDPRRAAISVYEADGSGARLYAVGLRNAVGLALAPPDLVPHGDASGLWATNMGRDHMGDDLPPETVYAIADGMDAGWPRCHAGDLPDPEFGGPDACQGVAAPVVEFQAHSAPLALLFYTGAQFPADYRGDLFIAYHGSWNRSEPTGYKVVRVPMDGAVAAGPPEDFASGWLSGGSASGRPAGLAQLADGSLLVSDDKVGVIYRIFYAGP
jgi:glucose/arabinose dehydrogenase